MQNKDDHEISKYNHHANSCIECPQFLELKSQMGHFEKSNGENLQKIEDYVNFKGFVKGLTWAIGLILTISIVSLFTLLSLFKSEVRNTLYEWKNVQASNARVVEKISDNVAAMSTNTAVLKNSVDLSIYQSEKDRDELKKRLENHINEGTK
jgi:hypothetical protein